MQSMQNSLNFAAIKHFMFGAEKRSFSCIKIKDFDNISESRKLNLRGIT